MGAHRRRTMPEFSVRSTKSPRSTSDRRGHGRLERELLAAIASRSLFPVEVRADAPVTHGTNVRRVPAQISPTASPACRPAAGGVPMLRSLAVLDPASQPLGAQGKSSRGPPAGGRWGHAGRGAGPLPADLRRYVRQHDPGGQRGGFLEEALHAWPISRDPGDLQEADHRRAGLSRLFWASWEPWW